MYRQPGSRAFKIEELEEPVAPYRPEVGAAESYDEVEVAVTKSSNPALLVWLYNSPVISFMFFLFVPFVLLALAMTGRPWLIVIGFVLTYVFFVGALLAPRLLRPKLRDKTG